MAARGRILCAPTMRAEASGAGADMAPPVRICADLAGGHRPPLHRRSRVERNNAMSKKITVLGSTGSIGRQSLEVIAACGMEAVALAANSSVKLMEEQARQFRPAVAALADEKAAADLRVRQTDTQVGGGFLRSEELV